jgi:hypothetical protein
VINAFEFKWNPKRPVKAPEEFSNAYPNNIFKVIHPDNYLEFVTGT